MWVWERVCRHGIELSSVQSLPSFSSFGANPKRDLCRSCWKNTIINHHSPLTLLSLVRVHPLPPSVNTMDTSASFHTTPYHGHQHQHHLDSNPSQGVTFTSRASSAAAAAAAVATTSPPTTATASRPPTVRASSRLSRRYGRTLAFSGERSGRKMRRLATGEANCYASLNTVHSYTGCCVHHQAQL